MTTSNSHYNYKEQKKYQLAIRLSSVVVLVFSILAFVHSKGDIKNLIMMSSVALSSLFCLIYTVKTKKYQLVFYILSACGVILPSLSVVFLNDLTHFTEWIWICTAILLAFLGTNYIFGFALVFISILSATLFVHYSVNENIKIVTERNTMQLIALNIEFLGAFGCGGYLLYLFHDFYIRTESALLEINSNLIEKNEQITQQDEEKTILVKEIHHRVKNNLQIITSLLRMQSNEVQHSETKKHFNDAINRVMAMSLIHQKLYQENTLAQIELENYINHLVEELVETYSISKELISEIKVDIKEIGLKSIVPIGLLLNELVSNSIEHGFTNVIVGKININVKEAKDSILLSYSDNGTWNGDKADEKSSFGLELIDLLTEQLEGTKELTRTEEGTFYKFNLKNLDH